MLASWQQRLSQPLNSNGYTLSMNPQRLGALQVTDSSASLATMRRQLHDQGYLWLRGFFDRKEVLDFRHHFFSAFADTGLLAAGTDPVDGIYSGDEDKALCQKRLMELVRSAAYESFCLQPKLWRFYDALFEAPSYLHKRKIVRYTTPASSQSTAAHYDLVYLRGGTDRVYSSWIPLGDIPVEMGGLLYLEHSDQLGRQLEAEFTARNASLSPEERISAFNKNMTSGGWVSKDLPAMAEKFNSRWLAADYYAGDMVVHSAYMIHAASSNQSSEGKMRLSTDIRYQNLRDEIDARWSDHWTLEDML